MICTPIEIDIVDSGNTSFTSKRNAPHCSNIHLKISIKFSCHATVPGSPPFHPPYLYIPFLKNSAKCLKRSVCSSFTYSRLYKI